MYVYSDVKLIDGTKTIKGICCLNNPIMKFIKGSCFQSRNCYHFIQYEGNFILNILLAKNTLAFKTLHKQKQFCMHNIKESK